MRVYNVMIFNFYFLGNWRGGWFLKFGNRERIQQCNYVVVWGGGAVQRKEMLKLGNVVYFIDLGGG